MRINHLKTPAVSVSWLRLALLCSLAVALVLNALWAAPAYAEGIAPDAGVEIRNVAQAHFSDASGAPLDVTSNSISTKVLQVYAVDLSGDVSKPSAAGGDLYFPFSLYNTGNGNDTFTVSASTTSADITAIDLYPDPQKTGKPGAGTQAVSLLTNGKTFSTGALQRYLKTKGNDFSFVIKVATGDNAAAGTNDVTLTVQSVGDTAKTATKTASYVVVSGAAFDVAYVAPTTLALDQNATALVKLDVKNTGAEAGPVYVEQILPTAAADLLEFPAKFDVKIGGVVVPDTGAIFGDKPAVKHAPTSAENNVGVAFWLNAGQATTVEFSVKTKTTAKKGASQSITAKFGSAVVDTVDTTKPTLVFADTSPLETPPLTIRVKAEHKVVVTHVDNVALAMPGVPVKFSYTVENKGSVTETVKLTPGLTELPVHTPYQLLVGDGILFDQDSLDKPGITIDAGKKVIVDMVVTLPLGTATSDSKSQVSLTGTWADGNSDTGAADLSAIGLAKAGLTGKGLVSVDPEKGGKVILTVTNNNPLDVDDVYHFNAAVPGNIPVTVNFYAVGDDGSCTTMPLSTSGLRVKKGATGKVCATLSPLGKQKTVAVTFNANSVLLATANLAVTFDGTKERVQIAGNRQGTVRAGESSVYVQAIKNQGNTTFATNALKITIDNSKHDWTSEIYLDPNNTQKLTGVGVTKLGDDGLLAAGGGPLPILVKVTSPAGAAIGDQNDSVVMLSKVVEGESDAALATAVISTIVSDNQVAIQLMQTAATEDYCTSNTVPADSEFDLSTKGVMPGQCLWYRVEVTNDGDQAVTSVRLTGAVPAHTTFVSPGETGTAQVQDGVERTVETILPQGKAKMTYKVKVNNADM